MSYGLTDVLCSYHQFCRFLGKLKSNYQLTELVNTDGYKKWIQLASQFSIDSFRRWQLSSASSHYILQLWSRMVSAMPYVREEAGAGGHLLKRYVPEVFYAYVDGKLSEIEAAVKSDNGMQVTCSREPFVMFFALSLASFLFYLVHLPITDCRH